MKKTRKYSTTYQSVPTHMQELPPVANHSREALIQEIEAFTTGPNIPDFIPEFVLSLSKSIKKNGNLSVPQVNAYLNLHARFVHLGYFECPECQQLTTEIRRR